MELREMLDIKRLSVNILEARNEHGDAPTFLVSH